MSSPNPYRNPEAFTNPRYDWWNGELQGLHYAEYQINPETVIMVGARPDCYGTTPAMYKSIEGWINVSDRFIRHDKNVTNSFMPWNEGGQPQIETIFAILKTLDYWINEQKLKRIYISCDGGTHRAVTMFGLYLLAYEKERADEINKNYKFGGGRDHWSNPLEYARSYISEGMVPALDVIIEKIKDNTVGDKTAGVSLDSFLKKSVGEKALANYYKERFMTNDLKEAWFRIKTSFMLFFTYYIYKRPKSIASIWLHKKLNTKKGQFYKKHNF
jgi:hypothetical protein